MIDDEELIIILTRRSIDGWSFSTLLQSNFATTLAISSFENA